MFDFLKKKQEEKITNYYSSYFFYGNFVIEQTYNLEKWSFLYKIANKENMEFLKVNKEVVYLWWEKEAKNLPIIFWSFEDCAIYIYTVLKK